MEFLKHRNVLVCAREAGQGAFLAALLARSRAKLRGRIYAYPHAAGAFSGSRMPLTVVAAGAEPNTAVILDEVKPSALLIGASVGWSLEKALLVEARRRHIPVFAFVDHYWNMWQRFADEKTQRRWHYLPTRIYVIDRFARRRAIALGCPTGRLRICPHPRLQAISTLRPKVGRAAARRSLGIAPHTKVALFVSESLFRRSKAWRWEQAAASDYIRLFKSLVAAARSAGNNLVILKRHPAETIDWTPHLRGLEPSLFRIVDEFDSVSLLDAVDAVFGINSMLLLEALERGRKVYAPRTSALSRINPRITPLPDPKSCGAVIKKLISLQRSHP